MTNGDSDNENRENSRQADESSGRQNEARRGAQEIALTGLGVRVEILQKGKRESKCRRLQDGKEITVATAELIFQPPSEPEDRPRELFQHSGIRWRDPAEIS
jgi:hypothetical protein